MTPSSLHTYLGDEHDGGQQRLVDGCLVVEHRLGAAEPEEEEGDPTQ